MVSHTKSRTQNPVVLVPLTHFGAAVAAECQRRLGAASGNSPWLTTLGKDADLPTAFRTALTDVLSVGHLLASFPEDLDREQVQPQIWLLAAAAELTGGASELLGAVNAIRSELQRGDLPADVVVQVYTGPVEGRLPEGEIVVRLNAAPNQFALLVISDCSHHGFRLTLEQVVLAAGLQMELLIRNDAIFRRVLEAAAPKPDRGVLSLGVARIRVSPQAVQAELQACLRRVLGDRLLATAPNSESGSETTTITVTAENVTSILRSSSGSLSGVLRTMNGSLLSRRVAARDRCMKALRQQTEESLRTLIPRPTPYRSLWRRFWDWLWGRSPNTVSLKPIIPNAVPKRPTAMGEGIRIRMLQMIASCGGAAPQLHSPWELPITSTAERGEIDRQLPSLDHLVWQALTQAAMQVALDAPEQFARSLDDICRHAARDLDLSHWLDDRSAVDLVRRAAVLSSPLVPGGNRELQRLALIPDRLGESWRQELGDLGFEFLAYDSSEDLMLISIATLGDSWESDWGEEHDSVWPASVAAAR